MLSMKYANWLKLWVEMLTKPGQKTLFGKWDGTNLKKKHF